MAECWKQIKKIQKDKIGETELKKAKNYLIGNFYLSQERNKSQAYSLGMFETLGVGDNFPKRYINRIKKIQGAEIKKAAQTYLKKNNSLMLSLEPAKNK